MAIRRMTSLEVTDTDAFLDMPSSSQLLYFHLNARADDDGFVASPKKILRSLGGNDDDLKVLIGKKFVISFQDGVIVIKHWRVNNYIRKDIYKETQYLDLKRTLFIRPNGAYTQTDNGEAMPVPDGHFQLESVSGMLKTNHVHATSTTRALRVGQVRIESGKDRDTSFAQFYEMYPRKVGKKSAEKAWAKINPDCKLLKEILFALEVVKKSRQWTKDGNEFVPHPATWLNGGRWNDEVETVKTIKKTDKF